MNMIGTGVIINVPQMVKRWFNGGETVVTKIWVALMTVVAKNILWRKSLAFVTLVTFL